MLYFDTLLSYFYLFLYFGNFAHQKTASHFKKKTTTKRHKAVTIDTYNDVGIKNLRKNKKKTGFLIKNVLI